MLIGELLPYLRGNLKLTFGYRTSNGRSKNNSICTCKASEWRDKVPVFILNARLDDISSSNIGTIRISLVDDFNVYDADLHEGRFTSLIK